MFPEQIPPPKLLTLNDRARIVEEACKWMGTPWKHQGRSRRGLDCAGLLIVVGKALSIPLPNKEENYPRIARFESFVTVFKQYFHEKTLLERLPGDVIIFRDMGSSEACHAGILASSHGQEGIIHAYAACRKVVWQPFSGDLAKYASYCFEFPPPIRN